MDSRSKCKLDLFLIRILSNCLFCHYQYFCAKILGNLFVTCSLGPKLEVSVNMLNSLDFLWIVVYFTLVGEVKSILLLNLSSLRFDSGA